MPPAHPGWVRLKALFHLPHVTMPVLGQQAMVWLYPKLECSPRWESALLAAERACCYFWKAERMKHGSLQSKGGWVLRDSLLCFRTKTKVLGNPSVSQASRSEAAVPQGVWLGFGGCDRWTSGHIPSMHVTRHIGLQALHHALCISQARGLGLSCPSSQVLILKGHFKCPHGGSCLRLGPTPLLLWF